MALRVTTFNLENLFNRYLFLDEPTADYEKALLPAGVTGLDRAGRAQGPATAALQRNHTARAILDSKPDILVVQEVENLWTLRSFNDTYLDGYFEKMIMVEGNDGRGIDVGLAISKRVDAKVAGIRTHADEPLKKGGHINRYFDPAKREWVVTGALFSRDCLEVDIQVGGKNLTFLVNHFKAQGGEDADNLRRAQATRVAELAKEAKGRGSLPIVCGDCNEHWHTKARNPTLGPLHALVSEGVLCDGLERLGEANDWTYYYAVGHSKSRFDNILVDGTLRKTITEATILRKGLTLKCADAGERYPGIGYVDTEASDHCPVTVVLDIDIGK